MNYYVARNGQTYGPYSEDTVRKYLTDGSMQASDMGRTDAMSNWEPLGQILGSAGEVRPTFAPPPPANSTPVSQANMPPSLHWALVLLIAAFSSGIFITIWAFIQANWIKSIDPASRAIRDLIIGIILPLIGFAVFLVLVAVGGISLSTDQFKVEGATSLVLAFLALTALGCAGFIFHLKATFGMRDSMDRYYNTVEPINLRLSAVMTFFFNVLYLQYHMTRIADWKRTGILLP
jgi:hypothetical protein